MDTDDRLLRPESEDGRDGGALVSCQVLDGAFCFPVSWRVALQD